MTDKSRDVSYLFDPWDGTPGEKYDKFEENLLNASSKTDDRGWSLADHMLGTDEGGAAGTALPAGAADRTKAVAARRKRQKESYGIITRHLIARDIVTILTKNHFQDGEAAFTTVRTMGAVAVDRLKLKELDDDWEDISILHDIGVNENTITLLAQRVKLVNSKRPAANAKDETEQTERFLECIFKVSKHFSEGALIEYQAPLGSRQFEHPAPVPPAIRHRNFAACEAHYAPLWRNAVRSRLPGFHVRQPQSRPTASTRQTLEQASTAQLGGKAEGEPPATHLDLANAAADDAYVPRPGSPSDTLAALAFAGDELASRRGTITTTDWSMLSADEMRSLANAGSCDGAESAYLFDADDQASVELLCDCCGGAGHLKRVCPSSRNRSRSHAYIIGLHQAKMRQKDARGPPRRVPGRGQRPPFRTFSKRFQPRTRPPGGNPRARSAEEGAEWEFIGLNDDDKDSATVATEQIVPKESASTAVTSETSKFAFRTSDDDLFDHCRVGIEAMRHLDTPPGLVPNHPEFSPVEKDIIIRPRVLLGAVLATMTAVATAYEFITRYVGYVPDHQIAAPDLAWAT